MTSKEIIRYVKKGNFFYIHNAESKILEFCDTNGEYGFAGRIKVDAFKMATPMAIPECGKVTIFSKTDVYMGNDGMLFGITGIDRIAASSEEKRRKAIKMLHRAKKHCHAEEFLRFVVDLNGFKADLFLPKNCEIALNAIATPLSDEEEASDANVESDDGESTETAITPLIAVDAADNDDGDDSAANENANGKSNDTKTKKVNMQQKRQYRIGGYAKEEPAEDKKVAESAIADIPAKATKTEEPTRTETIEDDTEFLAASEIVDGWDSWDTDFE